MRKQQILSLLSRRPGQYVSGEEMSRALEISRAAVWKAIDGLRQEGYAISSTPNRGYRLDQSPDKLSPGALSALLPPGAVVGRELVVLTDPPRRGIVTCPAGGEADKSIPLSELFVDVGLSQTEAERAVPVGTPMVYRGGCFALGEDQMCGKSMDDRSCFVTLLRAAELLRDRELDVDLYLLGSTREEVSGAGATVGTWAVQPDFCVAVDVTHGKTPDGPADKAFAIGGGPAIGVGPNMTRWMTNRMLAKAKERQIPYQLEVMSGHTGTNGWEMQISREGVATSVLSLPLKYMHSPIEVLSLADMEQVAALLVAFTEGLGKEAARR